MVAIAKAAGSFVGCTSTAVIAGIVEVAMEVARALGFLRPPWGLAYDQMIAGA